MKMREMLLKFDKGELKDGTKNGNYLIEDGKIYYAKSGRYNNDEWPELLAVTLKSGRKLYNAAQLAKCGTYSRGTQAPIQRLMQELKLPLVPFNVFEEAKLDIQKAKVLEQGKPRSVLVPKQVWRKEPRRYINVQTHFTRYTKTKGARENERLVSEKEVRHGIYEQLYIDLKQMEKRHFVGAMLIQIGNKRFLFDLDRREVKYNRQNVFLTQVKGKPTTIKEAYEGLKPQEVKEAEKKGTKVKRQGEWFFIEADERTSKEIEEGDEDKTCSDQYDLDMDFNNLKELKSSYVYKEALPKYRKQMEQRFREYKEATKKPRRTIVVEIFPRGGELQAGGNRPNHASNMAIVGEDTYVKGRITHSGREHEPLKLGRWHKAIANTAVKSFTIEGNID